MSKEIALVLSCGGARGLAQIGVIEALIEEGYEIKSISGCSIGALIGGFYAAGKLDVYKDWVCGLSKKDVFNLMDFTFSSKGFIKGRVFSEMKKMLGEVKIEDLEIPFSAIAADVHNHEEFVFDKGNLHDAIRASVAVPSFIHPCFINGKEFIDGGIVNPIPLNRVQRKEGQELVAVNVNSNVDFTADHLLNSHHKEEMNSRYFSYFMNRWLSFSISNYAGPRKSNILGLIGKSIELMQSKLIQLSIEHMPPDLLVSISKQSCNMFEFHKAEFMIAYGKLAFRESLKEKQATERENTSEIALNPSQKIAS
ncbi:MAG: patatin-like phospholipase family protein [Bacteroidota bacterium]